MNAVDSRGGDTYGRAAMNEDRLHKLEERVVWLEASMVRMRANYERSPKFAALILLALPVGLAAGALWAFLVALMVVSFVGVLVYIAWSHVNENEEELKSVRAELKRLKALEADARAAASHGA